MLVRLNDENDKAWPGSLKSGRLLRECMGRLKLFVVGFPREQCVTRGCFFLRLSVFAPVLEQVVVGQQ